MKRIPSLDGLRALSILLVILQHTLQTFAATRPVPWYAYIPANGALGVTIFFGISGYLITSLLLGEHEKTSRISLKAFYLRRVYRIYPPLYAYIAFLVVLAALGRLHLTPLNVLAGMFLFGNYVPASTVWPLEHTWSLCIEEQFYLLWPFVLMVCLRRPGIAGRELAAKVALGLIVLSPFVRVVGRTVAPSFNTPAAFHMMADSLMFGCLAALLQGNARFEAFYRAATRPWWLPFAVLLVSGTLGTRYLNYWNYPVGFSLNGLCIMLMLLWLVRNPESVLGRVFNHRVVVHIGVLSYSLYLWQTFFLHHNTPAVLGGNTLLTTWPVSWLAILLTAEASFHLIERPLLRVRNRLHRKALQH